MISILLAGALFAPQAALRAPVTTGVHGRAINSSTGEAVPKVTVILRAHDPEHEQSYADETDSNGNFSMDDVQPGEYVVDAERAGFVIQSKGATGAPPPTVVVQQGEKKNLTIRLTPLGAIAGRVSDGDGDPVRDEMVEALQYVYTRGGKELERIATAKSGDNGQFRLFGLRAGTYHIRATGIREPFPRNVMHEFTETFYPSTISLSHATPVPLRAGAELEGFDIRMQPGGLYSIRFEFADGHAPQGGLNALIMPDEGPQPGQGVTFTSGDVVVPAVSPGSYEFALVVSGEGNKMYMIRHVDLMESDVDGGTITLSPPSDVAGSVVIEGGNFDGRSKIKINLQSQIRNPLTKDQSVAVNVDGSFLLKDVPPVAYEVSIDRTPGLYLKSVRMDDRPLSDRRIDASAKLTPLTVVLGADAGEVDGAVRNSNGEATVRARVDVIAYGDKANRLDLNRFGFTNEKGEFKIKDVPPGEYKVFAWEDVPEEAPQDPEFRKQFETQAATVRVQPNALENVSVIVIPASKTLSADQ